MRDDLSRIVTDRRRPSARSPSTGWRRLEKLFAPRRRWAGSGKWFTSSKTASAIASPESTRDKSFHESCPNAEVDVVDTAETVATRGRGLNDRDGRRRWETVGALSRGPIVNRNTCQSGVIEDITSRKRVEWFSVAGVDKYPPFFTRARARVERLVCL